MAESMFVLMSIPVISWRMALKMVTTGRALQPQQGLDGLPTAPRQLWKTNTVLLLPKGIGKKYPEANEARRKGVRTQTL